MSQPEFQEAAGLPAREAAIDLLSAAVSRRAGMEEGLSHPALGRLEPRDRAFARALVMATLRHLGTIDQVLQSKLKKPPPDRVVQILRLAVAQLFVLKTPAHAAVSSAVDLAQANSQSRALKGLVNAVLRALTREPPVLSDPDQLAPPWLYARWSAAYGPDAARAMAARIVEEPSTDLTPKSLADVDGLAAELDAQVLPGGTLRTPRRGEVSAWPGFIEGRWWVQDAAAAVPARLLHVKPGVTALDLCAAPGGKTLQLAAAGAQVVAVDRSATRLKRVSENLTRMNLTAEIVSADGAEWRDGRVFDAVLLDAPCSATGTFRRNPDVLWAAKPGDVASLAAVQARLLNSAAGRVRPGGQLVYCVCSLEPEEGEAQIAAFLQSRDDFALAPIASGEGGSPEASLRPDGTLRMLPHHRPGGLDGFYVARFQRR